MKRATAILLILVFIPLVLLSLSCSRAAPVKTTKKHASGKPAAIKKIAGPNKIFFLSARDGSDQIYSINPDGTGLKKLTDESDGILKQGFDVSKDGAQIVFYGPRGDYSAQPEMDAANTDGSGLRPLGNGRDALWSPDGKLITFIGTNETDSITPVNVINSDGTGRREIAADGFAPVWSSAGDKIVYFHLTDVATSKGTARVVNLSGQLIFDFGVSYPKNFGWAFSPDDKRLAYFTWEDNSLRIGETATGKPTATIIKDIYAISPLWSPDGASISYQAFAAEPDNTANEGIRLYDTKTGQDRLWIKWYSSNSRIYSWDPNSAAVAISGDPNLPPPNSDKALPLTTNIWILSKTGALKQITDSGQDYSPIWR
jgi:Tol biopolymer transport system component